MNQYFNGFEAITKNMLLWLENGSRGDFFSWATPSFSLQLMVKPTFKQHFGPPPMTNEVFPLFLHPAHASTWKTLHYKSPLIRTLHARWLKKIPKIWRIMIHPPIWGGSNEQKSSTFITYRLGTFKTSRDVEQKCLEMFPFSWNLHICPPQFREVNYHPPCFPSENKKNAAMLQIRTNPLALYRKRAPLVCSAATPREDRQMMLEARNPWILWEYVRECDGASARSE